MNAPFKLILALAMSFQIAQLSAQNKSMLFLKESNYLDFEAKFDRAIMQEMSNVIEYDSLILNPSKKTIGHYAHNFQRDLIVRYNSVLTYSEHLYNLDTLSEIASDFPNEFDSIVIFTNLSDGEMDVYRSFYLVFLKKDLKFLGQAIQYPYRKYSICDFRKFNLTFYDSLLNTKCNRYEPLEWPMNTNYLLSQSISINPLGQPQVSFYNLSYSAMGSLIKDYLFSFDESDFDIAIFNRRVNYHLVRENGNYQWDCGFD